MRLLYFTVVVISLSVMLCSGFQEGNSPFKQVNTVKNTKAPWRRELLVSFHLMTVVSGCISQVVFKFVFHLFHILLFSVVEFTCIYKICYNPSSHQVPPPSPCGVVLCPCSPVSHGQMCLFPTSLTVSSGNSIKDGRCSLSDIRQTPASSSRLLSRCPTVLLSSCPAVRPTQNNGNL